MTCQHAERGLRRVDAGAHRAQLAAAAPGGVRSANARLQEVLTDYATELLEVVTPQKPVQRC